MRENVIVVKSKSFAVKIVQLYKFLVDERKEYVMSKQLLRSGTSIGANVHESINAQSTSDFVHKLSIALKEADETSYWLELLKESAYIANEQYDPLYKDCCEIIAILTSIIKRIKSEEKI